MQDYYRFRFQRPGIAPDRGLSRVMGWVVGAGIAVLVTCIALAGTGRGPPPIAGAFVLLFGLFLTPAALYLAPLAPRLARWLAMGFSVLGLLGSLIAFGGTAALAVSALASLVYFTITIHVLLLHWIPQHDLADRSRPAMHSRFHRTYRRLRADDLPVDDVIRRIRLRAHRRRRRSARVS